MPYRGFFATIFCALMAGTSMAQNQGAALTNFLVAVTKGDLRMATLMLDRGFPNDTRTPRGETPLLVAVQAGQTAAAELLIVRGADINAQTGNKDTPWLLAGARGQTAMLAAMLPKRPERPRAKVPRNQAAVS